MSDVFKQCQACGRRNERQEDDVLCLSCLDDMAYGLTLEEALPPPEEARDLTFGEALKKLAEPPF